MYCSEGLLMRDHFQLNVFWGLKSLVQMNLMTYHLDSLWGATLMLLRGCVMDTDETKQ